MHRTQAAETRPDSEGEEELPERPPDYPRPTKPVKEPSPPEPDVEDPRPRPPTRVRASSRSFGSSHRREAKALNAPI